MAPLNYARHGKPHLGALRGAASRLGDQALARMTILPARRLEGHVLAMKTKGRIAVGADADLTVFDPATVLDRATFEAPTTLLQAFRKSGERNLCRARWPARERRNAGTRGGRRHQRRGSNRLESSTVTDLALSLLSCGRSDGLEILARAFIILGQRLDRGSMGGVTWCRFAAGSASRLPRASPAAAPPLWYPRRPSVPCGPNVSSFKA